MTNFFRKDHFISETAHIISFTKQNDNFFRKDPFITSLKKSSNDRTNLSPRGSYADSKAFLAQKFRFFFCLLWKNLSYIDSWSLIKRQSPIMVVSIVFHCT